MSSPSSNFFYRFCSQSSRTSSRNFWQNFLAQGAARLPHHILWTSSTSSRAWALRPPRRRAKARQSRRAQCTDKAQHRPTDHKHSRRRRTHTEEHPTNPYEARAKALANPANQRAKEPANPPTQNQQPSPGQTRHGSQWPVRSQTCAPTIQYQKLADAIQTHDPTTPFRAVVQTETQVQAQAAKAMHTGVLCSTHPMALCQRQYPDPRPMQHQNGVAKSPEHPGTPRDNFPNSNGAPPKPPPPCLGPWSCGNGFV